MRVMYAITRGDNIGGAQLHVRDLAIESQKAGHEILVVCGIGGDLTEQLTAAGVESRICDGLLRAIHPLRDVAATREMTRIVRNYKPQLVSAHSSKAGVIGRIAARQSGVPSLFTAHGFAFTNGVPQPTRTIYRLIERSMSRLADRIICVSDFDRQIGIAAGMSPDRLITIHNGMIDVPENLRAAPDLGTPLRIVMTARFDRQKDHDTLFRAVATVPDVHLDLIGTGPDLDDMIVLAMQLGLQDRVRFLGQRNDVANILSRAHMFVLSSHWEGFPRSTLEAMRAGLPVVVADVGGSAEAVTEGVTGYVVQPRDREELAARIRDLVLGPDLRRTMGAAGRMRYENEFDFRIMMKKTLDLQAQIIDRTNTPAN